MTGDRSLKVLQILDALSMGGAETWLMELLRYWSKSGAVQMDFHVTGGKRSLFDDEVVALGGRIHYVRYGREQLPSFIKSLRRILRREKYDAMHDHADFASGWHFLMGLGCLPPVRVTHIHNPLLHLRANYAVNLPRRVTANIGRLLVLKLASHVCGTSGRALSEYGFDSERRRPATSVLHCGFDVSAFNSPGQVDRRSVLDEFSFPTNSKIVLFVGRLDRDSELGHPRNHKNSWLAALIARAAVDRDATVRLLMAGAGDQQRAELDRRIAGWGLADRLRMIGVRHDIGRLMRAADVLLFPSAEEGLGMVAVEAQAAGLPVVASTAVPAEARVIPDMFTALSLDTPHDQWAQTLLDVMARPRVCLAACRAALEASEFSIADSARRLQAVYRSNL